MNKKSYILGIGMSVLLIMFFITIIRGRPTGLASPSNFNLTPTAIPSDVLTHVAQNEAYISATQTAYPPIATQAAQTEQALQLTLATAPTLDHQKIYPILSSSSLSVEEIQPDKSDYVLAGYGRLYDDQEWSDDTYEFKSLTWEEWTYDSVIWVKGGQMLEFPTQGAIRVTISPRSHGWYSSPGHDVFIESPVRAGALTITGAIGERLILTSEQGQIFYFDVPALRFVANLEEGIPLAPPYPTLASEFPLAFFDDAPDEPFDVDAFLFQLEDADLNYYINSQGDYDWFYFISQAEGTLKVFLNSRGKNYGLRVILIDQDDNGTILGEDIESVSGLKQIIMPDAPRGNYIVRVWSLDGSYDESQPYTIRFEPPKPEKVIPILECVAGNTDGTFTAHFGYDNPNSYVVTVFADRDNSFRPKPVFRTGQPEYFVPGPVEDWFSVLFDGNDLTWRLDSHSVTANRNSPRCP